MRQRGAHDDTPLARLRLHDRQALLGYVVEIDLPEGQVHLAGLDLRQVQKIVEQAHQVLAGGVDIAQILAIALRSDGTEAFFQHHLRKPDDGVERRANLVAHTGQEVGLVRVRLFGGVTRGDQVVFGLLEGGKVPEHRAVGGRLVVCQAAERHEDGHQPPLCRQAFHLAAFVEQRKPALAGDILKVIERDLAAVLGEQETERPPFQILHRITHKGLRRLVDVLDGSLAVQRHDPVARKIDDRLQFADARAHQSQGFVLVQGLGSGLGGGLGSGLVGDLAGMVGAMTLAQRQERGRAPIPPHALQPAGHRHAGAVGLHQRHGAVLRRETLGEKGLDAAIGFQRLQAVQAGHLKGCAVGVKNGLFAIDDDAKRQPVEHHALGARLAARERKDLRAAAPFFGFIGPVV